MKPNCKGCSTGVILDFTNNTDGLCVRCRWDDIQRWFTKMTKHFDSGNLLDPIEIDKQNLVERSNNYEFFT